MKKTVYIFGHKNPDTDSAVAATAYAKLKELQGFSEYKAARAGHFNPQTDYIYKRFKVPFPKYLPELSPKVAYYMKDDCVTVEENRSVWFSINKLNQTNLRAIPVVDKDGKYKSLLHYSTFAQKLLTVLNPEKKINISTSVSSIIKTMNAQALVTVNEDEVFKAGILVGGATDENFEKMLSEHASENTIVITSDREKIYEMCIRQKVKLLIITTGFVLKKELKELAEKNKVNVIMSPYDTSATVMMIAYSTPVSLMADPDIPAVRPEDTISKVRKLIQNSPIRRLPVVDGENKVIGMISEHDLTNEPNIQLILVDHNEKTQAVEGFEHYKIQEVIDHHRLGTFGTTYPITFINKPVGSTATLISGLYQEAKVPIPKDIASLLLCGILSDTLILQSATTTETDRQTAEYLSNITDLDIQALGKDILQAGSGIKGRNATQIIHQDMKEYSEDKGSFTVSQIEVSSLEEVLARKDELMQELEIERRGNKALFSSLLVTDITQLSSILVIACDPKFAPFITFPKVEPNVYFLKDVVSRKKQLIPLISEQVENYEK
ncbi:MAG: putative manganese-dependent inorganic diphosphatase [Treponema sp.]|nr:putative manganese-dependent inorganic diphosphatase [Treponema sp.]